MAIRRVVLKEHLSSEELENRYRSCKDWKEARRWHALWLVSTGHTTKQAALIVGLESDWVRKIIRRYNEVGAEGVIDGHRINPGGSKFRVNAEQQEMLIKALKSEPTGGGLWTGLKVAALIEQMTGIKTYPQLGWVYLKRIGIWLKVLRRKHSRNLTTKKTRIFYHEEHEDHEELI